MNILLIGNGFDLAHGLPTRYTDFLEFIKIMKAVNDKELKCDETINWGGAIEKCILNYYRLPMRIKWEIIAQLKDIWKKGSEEIEELLSLIADNFWLEYFLECPMYQKENWIDFESEISRIIRSIDSDMREKDFDGQIQELTNEYLSDRYLHDGMSRNGFGEWPGICKITYRELRDALLKDLNRLIRILEIYLYSLVARIPCNGILPDVQDICFDKVLSFNYTDTYRKKYDKQGRAEYDFIHGRADAAHTIATNNMVLGIDEYLSAERKDADVEFIAFKKYYQRIYKETGCYYKKWLRELETDNLIGQQKRHDLYIFGHSLDVTDKDVLRDLILHDHVNTTIFYFNKDDFGAKITNLVRVIGQDELIRRTGGDTKTIWFKQQQEYISM